MPEAMFDVLIYTDCTAEESVNGRTGFQFMAESAGVSPSDEEVVRTSLLHSVPTGVDLDRPELHPSTCAYREQGGRFYMSRGRSLGKTLTGRPGNQLTQAIVSSDEADLLPLRPAQLCSCPHWRLERVTSTTTEPWQTPLEIATAFETRALHSMVSEDPWASSLLPTFLTMVEQVLATNRTKLIIKHPDQTLVMRWIALASIFVDGSTALHLGFRVYSADPAADPFSIVGAHPRLSPNITVAEAESNNQNLVDLERREATTPSASPTATRHASWFLEYDPYEALEAIEVSRRWGRVIDPNLAAAAAAVACFPQSGVVPADSQRAAVAALSGLAAAGHDDELEAYGDGLLDAVVGYRAQAEDDIRPLAAALWALSRADQSELAEAVALTLLEWAVKVPSAGDAWANAYENKEGNHRSLAWSNGDTRDHAAGLVSTYLNQVSDPALPAAFSLARALNTGVGADALRPSVQRLASYWASHPELTRRARSWLHRELVIEQLAYDLAAALDAQNQRVMSAFSAGQWDWLVPLSWRFDPQHPISLWLGSRTLAKAAPGNRASLLSELSPAAPVWAWPLFLNATDDNGFSELIRWVVDHARLDDSLARHLEAILSREFSNKPSGRTRELLAALAEPGRTGLTSNLNDLVRRHVELARLWSDVGSTVDNPRNTALRQLSTWPREWLSLYRPSIAAALIDCADRESVLALAKRVQVGTSLDNSLSVRLQSGEPAALVGALRLLADGKPEHRRIVNRRLLEVWDLPAHEMARQQLQAGLPAKWKASLADFEKAQSKNKVARDIARGARNLIDRTRGD
jgi:GTPase-associated protein 1, N-terminal domain type 2/GTPase-associated protein 1, middle domain